MTGTAMESDVERQLGEGLMETAARATGGVGAGRLVESLAERRTQAREARELHGRMVVVKAITDAAAELSATSGLDYAEALQHVSATYRRLRGWDAVKELLDAQESEASLLSARRVRHALEHGHQLQGHG